MSKKTLQLSNLEKAIIKAIENSGMNQLELAAKSGVDQGTISRFLEKDPYKRRSVTLPIGEKLCKELPRSEADAAQPDGGTFRDALVTID